MERESLWRKVTAAKFGLEKLVWCVRNTRGHMVYSCGRNLILARENS